MNNLSMLLMLISFMIGQVQKNGLSNIQENFSHKTQVQLQRTMNKIFILLQMNKTFNKLNKTVDTVKLLEYNKRIAANNWKIYNNLTFITKPKESAALLFKLNDIINEVSREFTSVFFNCTKESGSSVYRNINSNGTDIENCDPFFDKLSFFNDTLHNNESNERFSRIIDEFIPRAVDDFKNHSIVSNRFSGHSTDEHLHITTYRRLLTRSEYMIRKYPFMASIHFGGKYLCSGTIIYHNLVLTAASCLHFAFPSGRMPNLDMNIMVPFYVRYGSNDALKGGKHMAVENFVIPSDFPWTYTNNLALLKTIKNFDFTNPMVGKIPIDINNTKVFSSSDYIDVLGWDKEPFSNTSKMAKMSKLSLRIQDYEKCKEIFAERFSDSNLCAVLDVDDGECTDDIGGPGIFDGILFGVIGFRKSKCSVSDLPVVLTKIGSQLPWIGSMLEILKISAVTEFPSTNNGLVRSRHPYTKYFHNYKTKRYQEKRKHHKKEPSNNYKIEIKNILRDVYEDLAKAHNMSINDLLYGNGSEQLNVTFFDNSNYTPGSFEPLA